MFTYNSYTINLLTIVLIFLYIVYLWNKRGLYFLSWSLPGPFAFPFIGNALEFTCRPEDILDKCISLVNRYSSPFRIWFGPKLVIIFSEAHQAEKIFSSLSLLNKDDHIYRFLRKFEGEGLITATAIKWRKDRKILSCFFNKKSINGYFPVIQKHCKILTGVLKEKIDQPTFDIGKYLHRCSTDFVNETILGIKTNAQNGSLDKFLHQVDRIYVIIHSRIVKVWLQIDWLFNWTSFGLEHEKGKRSIREFMRNAIKYVEHKQESSDNAFPSTLEQMLNFPNFATEEELIDHLCTFYSAGEDTITTITSFALLLFGMYPDIQNKVVEEIFSVLADPDKDILLEDIPQLKYLEMCLKDVLRLFPIAPFLVRESSRNLQIEKCNILKDCSVMVAIHKIHRDPKHWEKPNDFYPEHFSEEAVHNRHPFAFLAFSAGPRMCIGKAYGYMAMFTLLVNFLKKYKVEADGDIKNIQLKADISIRPKNGVYPIRIKLRSNCKNYK